LKAVSAAPWRGTPAGRARFFFVGLQSQLRERSLVALDVGPLQHLVIAYTVLRHRASPFSEVCGVLLRAQLAETHSDPSGNSRTLECTLRVCGTHHRGGFDSRKAGPDTELLFNSVIVIVMTVVQVTGLVY
jgi:hypothetical protein